MQHLRTLACDPRSKAKLWPSLVLAVFFVVSLLSMRHQTLMGDEWAHLTYGTQILERNSNRLQAIIWASKVSLEDDWRSELDGQGLKLVKGDKVLKFGAFQAVGDYWKILTVDDSKMPISALNALPGKVASYFAVGSFQAYLRELFTARLATVITSMLLGYLCFHWSRELYGFAAGLLTLFLFSFEPNIIAHSQVVETDLYAAATITLALYTLWRYSLVKDIRHAAVLGLAVGLSQVAKYSGVFLFVLLPATLLLAEVTLIIHLIRTNDFRAFCGYVARYLWHGFLVVLITILMINVGYCFNRTFTPLQEYHFQSDLFQAIQSTLSRASFIRIPLPYPYLEGLDAVRFRERTGLGYARIYLLGQLSREGFPGYYLVAFLFKVPIAIQLIFLLAAVYHVVHWNGDRFRRAELFIFVPMLFFTVYFNFLYRAQIGIRFLLIVFPFILVFCGSLVERWTAFTRARKLGIVALSGYLVVSVLSYFPQYIPYFNELVYDRRYAYKILADSNIDWGQGKWYLGQYLKRYPATHVQPEKPVEGRIVVGVNSLTGVSGGADRYAWLREHLLPSHTIAYSYLVYEVSAAELEAIDRD